MSTRNIREGRYYTYLTSTFTHFNTAHLLFNMMALWSFGRPIIAIWGGSQFAILWAGSGLVGGFAQSSLWNKQGLGDERAIGASGSLFGLTTALACLAPQMRVVVLIFPMQLGLAMFSGAAFSVAAIRQNWLPWVGHADHLGGIAFGVIWYLVVLRRGRTGHVRSKIF
ncbi:hypothetical protein B0O99DRAFT_512532 [Bisporella sp. PMI_857]|nr:hypothetical protein B0O99DRAFT_512532 [Bisporella sp. PMI_857]